jgi:uncharacterized protein
MTTGGEAEHLWVTWDEYHRAIEALALKIHESDWRFDSIVCLARGGLRPGDVLSRIFKVPLAVLATSSYRESGGLVQGELEIACSMTFAKGPLAGRVLLVDDLVDSGVTLDRVKRHLRESFPEVSEVRSAVIWYKACSSLAPDIFLQYLPSNPWIHQPFETYDNIEPDQLATRLGKRGK